MHVSHKLQPNMAANRECVLCPTRIEKKGDVNLISGKRDFNVDSELKDLSFVVQSSSKHICRSCLNMLKQRACLKKKLDDINAKLLESHQEKALLKGFTVRMKGTSKRCLQFVDDLSMDQPSDAVSQPVPKVMLLEQLRRPSEQEVNANASPPPTALSFQPRLISTPLTKESDAEPADVPMQIDATTRTVVTIEVQWQSRTKRKVLRDDLSSLGKILCRGTYKQIARAAWRNSNIREQLVLLVLHEIDKECNGIPCRNKHYLITIYLLFLNTILFLFFILFISYFKSRDVV